ncbi:MAG: DUF4340 domain-containing protein [Labilithrix sp.]|nr:DUF4340 domain-containing protein [Labilithrix sp.]
MKRHATTVVLLLLAVALGVWLWLGRDEVTEGERQRRENNVFSAWRREDVSRLEIAHEGETIVLERDAKGDQPWRMTSPRQERVDQAAAERLMTTLEFAVVVRKVGEGAGAGESATLGFDAPRATGAVTMGPLVFRFTLGGPSPRPEGSGYLRVDDGPPFVASRELADALLAPSDTYRDRTVVPYLSLELARFEVKHPGGGFAVARRDGRTFDVEGLGISASRAALDKVWGALAEMRAEAFPKDADADRLTASPTLTIAMSPKEAGKPPGELVVGEACPGHPNDVVVLRTKPTRVAACAPRGAIDALLAIVPAALVDKKPFSFRHDEIEELRLESLGDRPGGAGAAPRAIEVARRGTGFHQREPEDRELTAEEADAVSELLSLIELGAADGVERGGGARFDAIARARVRAGDYEETVEIGALPRPAGPGGPLASPSSGPGGALLPAPGAGARDGGAPLASVTLRRVRDDARLKVTPALARRLVPRATTTRPRAILGETRRVMRVVLRCGTSQELVDSGAGLKLVEPSGYETDGSIVQLVDGLVRGKALAWVADADDGSFGLDGPAAPPGPCRVVLAFADANAPATVRFGAEGEGGVYGEVDGRPGVFVASGALHELTKRIYVSHAALRVPPEQIESVKVTSGGRPAPARDPAALRDAVGGLFVDRVVALGSSDVGPVDVDVQIAVTEGGPPKRVVCAAPRPTSTGVWRRCATPAVKATFDVRSALVDALLASGPAPAGGAREAGASDAGPRARAASDAATHPHAH